MRRAVVLLSGGLDSATVLAIARQRGFQCYTLSFDYEQRHKAELHASKKLSEAMGAVEHKLVKLDLSAIGGSALTDPSIAVPVVPTNDIPITYVPARNTIFLSVALGWAEVLNAQAIFIGVNAVDYSGYPDCRPEYIAAFQNLVNLATKTTTQGQHIAVETPLIHLSKADIIRSGTELGIDYSLTISCYDANSLGAACGACDACRLRKQGFAEAGVKDPTRYFKACYPV